MKAIFLICLPLISFLSCKGQQKNGTKESAVLASKHDTVLQLFKKQKEQFEFKGYILREG